MTETGTNLPKWWHDLLTLGGQGGFYRTHRGVSTALIRRTPTAMLVSATACDKTPVLGFDACAALGWSHLNIKFPAGPIAQDAVENLLTPLQKEGVFEGVTQIVILSDMADAAVSLATALHAQRAVVFGPGTDRANAATPMTVFYDPFLGTPFKGAKESLSLRMPFLGSNICAALSELSTKTPLLSLAISGHLTPQVFYKAIRKRGQLPRYQAALKARAQTRKPRLRIPNWPTTRGNVWMLEDKDGVLRYMSDQWAGRTIGFQEKAGRTLAQTPPLMLATLAVGDWCAIPRPMSERYPWHVVDADLNGMAPDFAARSHGVLQAYSQDMAGDAIPGVMALDCPCPGSTAQDLTPGGRVRTAIQSTLTQAAQSAAKAGKPLHVERVTLGLLAGDVTVSQADATEIYRDFILWLQQIIPIYTDQGAGPIFVVTQGAGQRQNGRAHTILAEGRLEAELLPDTIVAGPAYPYALMADMPATPDPDTRLLMDELEHRAVEVLKEGGRWFCPSLRLARQEGCQIFADFTALSPLVLDPGDHGFRLEGCENGAKIQSVQVISADRVQVDCDIPPQGGTLELAYAWGFGTAKDENCAANHGSLRDEWSAQSVMRPGTPLYRFALSGKTRIHGAYI